MQDRLRKDTEMQTQGTPADLGPRLGQGLDDRIPRCQPSKLDDVEKNYRRWHGQRQKEWPKQIRTKAVGIREKGGREHRCIALTPEDEGSRAQGDCRDGLRVKCCQV